MQKRKLGKSGLEVSAIGLGCMGMSFSYGPPEDKQEMIALIRAAVERGVTFFDTAEVYGPFTNEELVGEALAPVRDRVVIATKFGFKPAIQRPTAMERTGQPARAYQAGRRGFAQAAQDRCHRSLLPAPRRPERADRGCGRSGEGPDPRTARSSTSASRKRACRRSAAPTPSSRSRRSRANIRCGGASPEAEVLPALEELGIGFVPFSPLGKGFLTGKIDETTTFDSTDFRSMLPRFTPRPARPTRPWSISWAGSRAQKGDAGADRACLAARPEAVDRADPRHHETRPPGGEHRRGRPRTHAGRSAARSKAPPRRSRCKGIGTPRRLSG